MGDYLSRLIVATAMAAVWGIGGGFGMWFMWQYVANAYETWDYFPRAMFTIPALITLAYGTGVVAVLWLWINCLFNTEWAREDDVAEEGDSGRDTETAERERGGYMGTPESPRLRTDIQPIAAARWNQSRGAATNAVPDSPGLCRCGHTRVYHDFYHQRSDGEMEVCWCKEEDCGAKDMCDICECEEFSYR